MALNTTNLYFLGQDASQEFEDVGHGSAARLMLDEFYVGEVDAATTDTVNEALAPATDMKDKKSKSAANKLLYFLLALLVTGLGVGISFFNLST